MKPELTEHPDGGWRIIVEPGNPDSPVIEREDGSGLTLAEAEEAMDELVRR
jgi:hypothetical protein